MNESQPINPAPPMNAGESTEPKVQVTPLDRYTLGNAIRLAVSQHGSNSWCSVADEVLPLIASAVEAARAEAAKEITELRGWKDSAMTVLSGIDFQEIGKTLRLRLGSDVGPQILPSIRHLQTELSHMRGDAEAWNRQLHLERAEHAKVKAQLEELNEAWKLSNVALSEYDFGSDLKATLTAEQQAHSETKEHLKHYINFADGQNFMSDFRTAKEMRAALEQAKANATKAESSLAALEQDRERLDWLDKECEVLVSRASDGQDYFGHNKTLNPNVVSLRLQIDQTCAAIAIHTASSAVEGEK